MFIRRLIPMKSFFFFLFVVLHFVSWGYSDVPNRPEPQRLVNIFSEQKFLNEEQIERLETKLRVFSDSTSNQIVIVVVDSLNGLTANQYATELGAKWGVGQKKTDNGVIILLSLGAGEGQRDYYIAVGYGLEGAIPDLKVKRIQEKQLLPYLKSGNYYAALENTTNEIMRLAIEEYDGSKPKGSGSSGTTAVLVFIAGVGALAYYSKKNKNKKALLGETSNEENDVNKAGAMAASSVIESRREREKSKDEDDEDRFKGFGGGSFGGAGAGGKW